MWVPGSVLGAPALLIAGTAASAHCAAMCGALSIHHMRAAEGIPARRALLLVHGGRMTGYALLGALAGALGQSLLRYLPGVGIGYALQILAASTLILIGLRMLLGRTSPTPACCARAPRRLGRWPLTAQLFARGLLWAAVPCGLLYSVLFLAALSGSTGGGGLLTAAFALGGTPLLALVGWSGARGTPTALRGPRAGWILVACGALGLCALLWFHAASAGGAWCIET
ncbi:MAG: sulfite exporter TauE/SafE family protein [Nevskia sp.]|nr:sulfite exporter TauE/SafE family protein [Nevskia sp.]